VLVVDDDESIREFISLALMDTGYCVAAATDGAAALGTIPRFHPDLILLDMRMPVMNGWEFAATYRAAPGPHVPIIVLTAARDAAESAAEIQAQAYLAKPFDLDRLLDLIASFNHRA
jgi:two-component system chemotaxis response regulator CheY